MDTPNAPRPIPPDTPAPADPLTALSNAQVYARDPEDYTAESTADTIRRLSKDVARYRKARADEAVIKETTAKIKKTNTAAAKKKAKSIIATDPMETTI